MVKRPTPYDLHTRNHSYILLIVTKRRQHLQMLYVGIKIVLVASWGKNCTAPGVYLQNFGLRHKF